jgi:predicted PurR-regulated permease PerM
MDNLMTPNVGVNTSVLLVLEHLLEQQPLWTQTKTLLPSKQHQYLRHVLQHLQQKIQHLMWTTLRQPLHLWPSQLAHKRPKTSWP